MDKSKLMIIDGNSILNRAFYGIKGEYMLSTSDGLYTNAVYGFLNILFKFLEEEKPQYLCVAFDLKAPTFRHVEYEGYKAKRKGMPDELAVQLPIIKEVLDTMNIKRLEFEGFEADDIAGSISLCGEEMGMDVVIVTGDKDSLQLASDTTRIMIPVTRGGKTNTDEYDKEAVIEKYGVTPKEFIDVKALMGDPSDNIPGVPGVGEKTALKLIIEFKSIENLYENLEQVDKKGVRGKLADNKDIAFLSKNLATIERQMPKMCDVEDMKIKEFDKDKLFELFSRLEFKSLIERMNLKPDVPTENIFSGTVECISDTKDLESLRSAVALSGSFSIMPLQDSKDSFNTRLVGVALTYDKNNTVYIDLREEANEKRFLDVFKSIFEDGAVLKYGHDIKVFILYLKKKGIDLNGLSFDTMIAAYIIDPSRNSYTISELVSQYLDFEIDSVEQMSGKGKKFLPFAEMPIEAISQAAGVYSKAIEKLHVKFLNMIKQYDQKQLYFDIELPLVSVLADMEYLGFKVNPQGLTIFSVELKEKIDIITNEIYILAGEEFNINSTKQLGVILFEKLGLPIIKKTKTGYSTDAEVLEQLDSQHEIISKVLEYRQLVKLQSTYVEGLLAVINPETGKIHSSFNQTVAATGRISSTEPNLQNIPIKIEMGRKIRKVFVPSSDEYVLLDADYSQIELRVLAHISNDENFINAFLNNEDIHTTTASIVFNVPKEEVTPLLRSRAKAVNFGIVYGIGDFSLSKDIGVTRKEAKRYIDEYLNKYPGIKQYMHDTIEKGKEYGYVGTLFNRRRYLPELKSRNFNIRSFGERMAMNTPIQGSAADIIKIAMVKVYKELSKRKMKSRLMLQVHDELIIEAHRTEVEEATKILKESMESAAKLKVPLDVDINIGDNWYDLK